MKTQLLQADKNGIEKAGQLLKQGEVVGIPTETVYGLAASSLDGRAVKKIFEAKGRPRISWQMLFGQALLRLFCIAVHR